MSKIVNRLVCAWLCCYSALCYANTTFAQDVHNYDWVSLLFALAAGLLGGAARTILTLVSERELVGHVRLVLVKDLVVALMGGGVAYLLIQGYNAWSASLSMVSLPAVTRDFRVLLIVAAGFSRGRWMGVIDRFATDAIANASSKLRGGGAPSSPPSVAAPLGEQ
jgi:hypothetical protein